MKVGIVQVNTVIGDFAGNAAKVAEAYARCVADGADVVVAPELVVCGYPPRDLVFRSGFVPGNKAALAELAASTGEVPLLAGYVDSNDSGSGAPFFNAAALLQNGEVRQRFVKCLLPTYDVFDEARYFQPAAEVGWFEHGGHKIGVTICEDIWTEEYLPSRLYVKNPPKALEDAGADFIVNLSASPFHSGKPAQRERMLSQVACDTGCAVVYANAIGGHDQLVFDGNSVAVSASGKILARLAGFEDEVRVVDLKGKDELGKIAEQPEAEIFAALTLGVRDYLTKCGFGSAVLGLSGGIDSALTAAVAAEAIGGENVLGVTMPTEFSSEGSVSDSVALAENLGVKCHEIPIQDIFESVKQASRPMFGEREEDVTEENMQARIRGLLLMSASNKLGNMLLTTGNKSELAVGYCTIYGDMCGGLAVISDLPKMMVYGVSRWLNESRAREIIPWATIEKAPSAELRPDQKDQDSLPPYPVLDAILERYVEKFEAVDDIVETGDFDEETVRWVARRVDLNEWKRQQAAPGIRVTTKAFGLGRRFPIVQRYRS